MSVVARLAQWKSTSFTRKGSQVQVLQRAPSQIPNKNEACQIRRALRAFEPLVAARRSSIGKLAVDDKTVAMGTVVDPNGPGIAEK